ncbi:abortive infection family protein [Pseudonocardia tropica]|uniref:Abortive infection family protein n=1 Tax=Pseudonocardia tropica TaxID=681289 RepID=A0ABV1JZK5_9PSEU
MSLLRYFTSAGVVETFRLDRPDGLEDTAWQAIDDPLQRLNRALREEDLPLIIGCAKELVEATAKVVLESRGETAPGKEDMPKLLNRAQAVLDRQPGKGLATDASIRDIAQGALKICAGLAPLRNRYGTGHGRSVAPSVAEELALVSVDSAMLWTRWALRRLRHVILGRPEALIRDLGGAVFYRGALTERLHAVRLGALPPPDQSLLGLAVARRAMTGTFLVQEEGVERCAETHDLAAWPTSYRVGLVNGLLLNPEGQFHTTAWAIKQIALIAASLPDPGDALDEVAEKSWKAPLADSMESDEVRAEIKEAMSRASQIPPSAQNGWHRLRERFDCPF